MATYYIDGTNGDNGNNGTGPTTAKLTFAGVTALNPAAGSDIWVAPGTYKEAVVLTTSGTDATTNCIRWYGDVNCTKAWTSSVPGPVKISKADANGVPQDGKVLDFNAKTYNYFYDITFDGSQGDASGNVTVEGDSGSAGQQLIRCLVLGGYYGVRYMSIDSCVVIGTQYCCYQCGAAQSKTCINSVAIGYVPFEVCSCDNCLAIGTVESFYACDTRNCTSICGASAYWNPVTDCDNCLAIGNSYFYRDDQVTKVPPAGCASIACVNDTYNLQGSSEDLSTNRQIYTATERAATPCTDGHIFNLPPPSVMISSLARAFAISGWNDFDMADGGTPTAQSTDIEGRARTAYGVKHIGWQAVTKRSLSTDASAGHVIRVDREGDEALYVYLKSGVAFTASIACTSDLGVGTAFAVLGLSDTHSDSATQAFTPVTMTATATAQTLTVGCTPSRDCMARLMLRSMYGDATSTAYTLFHSLTIT